MAGRVEWVPRVLPRRDYMAHWAEFDADGQPLNAAGQREDEAKKQAIHKFNEEQASSHTINDTQFIDPEAWLDYICCICSGVAIDPQIHIDSPRGCRTMMCLPCNQEFNRQNFTSECPNRCVTGTPYRGHNGPLPMHVTANSLGRSRKIMNQLRLRCKFDRCRSILRFSGYHAHIDKCTYNPSNLKNWRLQQNLLFAIRNVHSKK